MEPLKNTVIIYHKNCHDGFASAWSAWKKFGDTASYIEASYGDELPEGVEGKDVYVLDFSYTKDILPTLEARAKSLVVIDHHKGAENHVKATKNHVFELDHSGAYLSWQFFHPDTKIPDFIEYLSESDIFRTTLPNSETICAYIFSRNRTFQDFDKLYEDMESQEKRSSIIEKGQIVLDYRNLVIEPSLNSIHFIDLAGVVVPAVNVTLPLDEKSHLLHKVYDRYPPVSFSYRYDEGEWKCSLRSNGEFDCIELAQKFGGSGHKGAAGFAIKAEEGVFPFKVVENPYI